MRDGHRDDTIIVVANLDPHQNQATWFHLNMPELGLRLGRLLPGA